MANEQNLIPNSERTPSELRKMCSNGGKASGVARRRKRTIKQAMELVMSLPVSDPKTRTKLKKMGIDLDDADNQTAVVVGLMARAMQGDPKAAKLMFEYLDDEHSNGSEQTEAHNALIDAIRGLDDED